MHLFGWDESTFLRQTEGGPIRRIGHERWLRNIAVALGNAPESAEIRAALASRSSFTHGSLTKRTSNRLRSGTQYPPMGQLTSTFLKRRPG